MHAAMNDAGALARSAFGLGNTAVTAGGGGDATQADGAFIDRTGFSSMKVIVSYTTTLAAAETLSFAAAFRDATSSGGAAAGAYGPTLASTVVRTGAVTGGTGTVEFDIDLTGAREFVQARITPDLSRANTDTAAFSISYVLMGPDKAPVTASLV